MRIIIENSSNQLENLGDVAMLQIAIERLANLWPRADLIVIAQDATRLNELFPDVQPLRVPQPAWWKPLRQSSWSLLPDLVQPVVAAMELRLRKSRAGDLEPRFVAALEGADVVVHSGAGVLADPFLPGALRRLRFLDLAVQHGKPTALFGQGIGPLADRRLRRSAVNTLPKVDHIAIRERANSLAELESLGVDPGIVAVTGDDAIELALRGVHSQRGRDLGLNLRLAPYSGLSKRRKQILQPLARALQKLAGRHRCDLRPIAIDPADQVAVERVLATTRAADHHEMELPSLLQSLARCRVVVSGSYHGAVLALGQGIPAIGLVASEYYWRKFTGLADMFGGLCPIVDLRQPGFEGKLVDAVSGLLADEGHSRGILLDRARAQVEASNEAYRVFHQNVLGQT